MKLLFISIILRVKRIVKLLFLVDLVNLIFLLLVFRDVVRRINKIVIKFYYNENCKE